jgi:hypothetical protein
MIDVLEHLNELSLSAKQMGLAGWLALMGSYIR